MDNATHRFTAPHMPDRLKEQTPARLLCRARLLSHGAVRVPGNTVERSSLAGQSAFCVVRDHKAKLLLHCFRIFKSLYDTKTVLAFCSERTQS
eukprot:272059-Amphidinium_carterae.1